MSKVKKTGQSHYEILFIAPNNYTEDEAKEINNRVKKMITDKEGSVTYEENWGKRKFAYKIKGFNHGYYCLYEFDLDGTRLIEIDTSLRLSNEILRHQIVRKKPVTDEQIKKAKKIEEKIEQKKIDEKKAEESKEKQKEDEKKTEAKEKDKLNLKDLDEKLESILDTNDLL